LSQENIQLKNSSVHVYPNPSDDVILIRSDYSIAKIEIYKEDGRLAFQEAYLDHFENIEINVSNFQPGIYKCYSAESATYRKVSIK